jgi:hypothetical protein
MSDPSSVMRIGESHTLRVAFVPGRLSFTLSKGCHSIMHVNLFPAYTKKTLWDYLVRSLTNHVRQCGGSTQSIEHIERIAFAFGPWEVL